jgi:predicted nucleic acid-binding protein
MGRFHSGPAAEFEEADGRVSGITLDASALIALDKYDRKMLALIARSKERGLRVTIPATALAQAMRSPARQARLARLIRQPGTDLVALNGPEATAVGLLLARTGTSDIADAHLALCAQRAGQAIATSDPTDLRRLAPDLPLVVV